MYRLITFQSSEIQSIISRLKNFLFLHNSMSYVLIIQIFNIQKCFYFCLNYSAVARHYSELSNLELNLCFFVM